MRPRPRTTVLLGAGLALVLATAVAAAPSANADTSANAGTSAGADTSGTDPGAASGVGAAGPDTPIRIPDGVPDDQPLPGYTIANPPLAPAIVNGQPSQVLQGVHGHAGYIIEVPPQWNSDLVMWAHGYRGQGKVIFPETPGFGLRQRLLDQGYAWASSSFYDNGLDIQAGVLNTSDLADYVADAVGKPHHTYLAGVSMGGYVIGRSLEQYPSRYDAALPMCGVLGDQSLLDFFLDYNLVAQDLAGVSAFPIPANYLTVAVPQIQVALGLTGVTPLSPEPANDLGRQLRAITINRSGGPRPGAAAAFAVWKNFLFGIAVPMGTGNTPAENPVQLATNLSTEYSPNSPVDVNATVLRVPPADLRDRISPLLTQVPHIDGRPTVPVLTLHDLGDLFVPFAMEQAYQQDVAKHERSGLLVQRAIRADQHCEFTPTEVGTAWDDLIGWATTGVRPAGDDVTDPAVVAAADYGCQFSDPAAWATGFGTRRLFPACT